VLAVDVDRFKQINDADGHHAGDAVLRAVSQALRVAARSEGRVGRLGGDEFALLLPGASVAAGARCGDEVRRRVAAACGSTVSIGVAAAPAQASTADGLLRAADRALYAAKDAGRDRVAVAPLAAAA
jgi:diguanylate cyclase (GGDEF)-like protein